MIASFKLQQRVRILTTGARLLNHGTIVDEERKAWVVRPDGCRRVRFSKHNLALIPNRQACKFPRLAP